MASHEQILQCTGDEQAVGILVQSAISDLAESDHAFQFPQLVLDLRAYPGLGAVALVLGFRNRSMTTATALGVVKIKNPVKTKHTSAFCPYGVFQW